MKSNMSILKYLKKISLNLSYFLNKNIKFILLLGLINYIYVINKILENNYKFVLLFFIILSGSYFIFKNFFIITTILILLDINNFLELNIIEGANSSKDFDNLIDEQKKENKKKKKKDFLDDDEKDLMEDVDEKKTGDSSDKKSIKKLDNPAKGTTPYEKNIKIKGQNNADKLTSF